jgi:hypothetical protein
MWGQIPQFSLVSTPASVNNLMTGRGVSVADYDNDGDDDIFITTSSKDEPNKLLRNDGNFVFTDVTTASGLTYFSRSQMGLWVDVNNDGWLDLYLGDQLRNKFYLNNKNGTFTDKTTEVGLTQETNVSALVAGDLNGDQWVDIYSNNFNFLNNLFLNRGNGTFLDDATGSGAESFGDGMSSVLFDVDRDHDLDIYLIFDNGNPNILYVNDGKGNFQDASRAYNVNYRGSGMGVEVADYDHDGYFDLYITNLFENVLFMRTTPDKFVNTAGTAAVDDKGMTWGVVNIDYNNDSFEDIYIINDYGFSAFPNRLFRNNGDGTFSAVSEGTVLDEKKSGYSVAQADFNNDGWQDLVVVNTGTNGIRIFRNEQQGSNWIQLNLTGVATHKYALGAEVTVTAGGEAQIKQVVAGAGYASQSSLRLHFGLGNNTVADEITVRWPDGVTENFTAVAGNQRYHIVQQSGIAPFETEAYADELNATSQVPVPPDTLTNNPPIASTHSVARVWNEALLDAIRRDLARPTVHARNLFQISIAMYDAWAAYEPQVSTYFLGREHGDFYCPFSRITIPTDKKKAQEEAISYAAFRLLKYKFQKSPSAARTLAQLYKTFDILGYDDSFLSDDYLTGPPAALGNYIAYQLIEFGAQDGSNELNGFQNQYYQSTNSPFNPINPGCRPLHDANRWQPIKLNVAIDQAGNPVSSTQSFLSAEWGNVVPFALTDAEKSTYTRDGHDYHVYYDPGEFPKIDTINGGGLTSEYLWNFSLVSAWASHLDPTDGVMIDVSPNAIGNIAEEDYPTTIAGLRNFYNLEEGGDKSRGYTLNPKTGQPYATQLVPRGDYTRVLAEYWADGPTSETPPGHWYSILNYVTDHPQFERRFHGEGEPLDKLEWDVKAYLTLGGAVHDAAISAWGIKGYYDGVRPVTAIRSMAERGQSSDEALPNYHPAGVKLIPGFIELVEEGDPLAGANNEHVGKVKLYTWRGPQYITNPSTDDAGAGWILGENWWPYQRPTFVTPPFAGYISGHSTYSSAGAQVMTLITGDEYFPGGLGEFTAKQNEYLVFEEGPSVDVKLQWAKYKDAADQCSLSRIWGGIHPPFDDMPGRFIGTNIGTAAYNLAIQYFNGEIITDTEASEDVVVGVYPNPAQGILNIELPADWQHSELMLHDTMGRKVHTQSAVQSVTTWNTSSLTKGLYILTIRTPRGTIISRKVVVR